MKTYKDVIMDYAQHNNLSLEKREELFKDFHLYNAETGWQDWMNDYTSAND
jgi:hypothetical protein